MNTKWFTYRKLKVLNYQSEVLDKIKTSMVDNSVTVLAACPSAGKTIMSIYCIEDYLIEHPLAKVLVLTHGTTVLRTQYHEVLDETKPGFSYNLVERFKDFNPSKQVNVCLPQTICGRILPHFDLIVVDEAHQFYFADMVQEIIGLTKPNKQLLLTGTPSPFIARNLPVIAIPLLTIYDEGMTADVRVEIATSSYNFDIIKDYNSDKELRGEIEIQGIETKKTLDELLEKVLSKITDANARTWTDALTVLRKTMFACKSQKQAMQVQEYFRQIGIKSALSISDIDSDSTEIQRFKDDTNCLVLIVVGRGILGFNYTRLVNIVDMSTSQNIDRIYQLFCRVVRKHPDGLKKLFFKIAPRGKEDYYKYVMTGVLALSSEEFFLKFNGKNFDELQIPVKKNKAERNLNGCKNKKAIAKHYEPIDFSNLPVFGFFKDVYGNDNTLNTYTLTDIKDVRAEFLSRKPQSFWTVDMCRESAILYSDEKDWQINATDAYNASKTNGWLSECLKLQKEQLINRLKKQCQNSASKYSSLKEWQKKDSMKFNIAMRQGWLNECQTLLQKKKSWSIF